MRIATRGSDLALWQARHVGASLVASGACPGVELIVVQTSGDLDKSTPLSVIGGKGVFVKEVQNAVLDGRADLAVHSAKDLPALTPEGLVVGAVPGRGDCRDALVGSSLEALRRGAVVATGSARRRAALAQLRPDLRFADLRGNIATRLEKANDFDAIVVAMAALDRLELSPPVLDAFSPEQMIPQVGQGALAVECRDDDTATRAGLARIDDPDTRATFECERSFLLELGGDCSLPAGAYAVRTESGELRLSAFLASEDLARYSQLSVDGRDGPALGQRIAQQLRETVERR